MKERPVLFSSPMIRAILDNRKSQTRRAIKPQPVSGHRCDDTGARHEWVEGLAKCPYGAPGDRLWVRETWKPDPAWGQSLTPKRQLIPGDNILFAATLDKTELKYGFGKWRPSIFMPRWASRITLEITEVRVQRVQEISEEDIIAEGATVDRVAKATGHPWSDMPTLHDAWRVLWDSINGKTHPWASSPWVWVISFRRVQP